MAASDVIDFGGEVLTVVRSSAEELVLDATWSAGTPPPPPHLHPRQDEHFELLEGELTVDVDGEVTVLREGDTVDIPRATRHGRTLTMAASGAVLVGTAGSLLAGALW